LRAGPHSPGTILCAVDLSAAAVAAFDTACLLARQSGGRVIVAHVAPIPALYAKRGYREEVEQALHRLARSTPGVDAAALPLAGEASHQILRAGREHGCGLIVMGTRGRGRLRRIFAGSVAREVRRGAPCPVLTVSVPCGAGGKEQARPGDNAASRGATDRAISGEVPAGTS
jgi:nucleotide-binding universal stress UspA family protein